MTARELLDYSLKAIGLRAMSNRATVTDAVWLRMVRGQKPDGSRGVPRESERANASGLCKRTVSYIICVEASVRHSRRRPRR